MEVACIHLPRRNISAVGAIYETTWQLVTAKFFLHALDTFQTGCGEEFTLELFTQNKHTYLCIVGTPKVIEYFTHCLHAYSGPMEVLPHPDYTQSITSATALLGAEMSLSRLDIFPLQNYKPFAYDSMAPMVAVLSQLPDTDQALVQFVCRPVQDGLGLATRLRLQRLRDLCFHRFLRSSTYLKRDLERKSWELVKEKCTKRFFNVSFRITSWSDAKTKSAASESATRLRLTQNIERIADAFKVYNSVDENQLRLGSIRGGSDLIQRVKNRRPGKRFLLSSLELTTLFHPPYLTTLPNTAQVLSKKAPPPQPLPSQAEGPEACVFGITNYRKIRLAFGLKRDDRQRHLYVIGKPGTGKSFLLQLLVRNDIVGGHGCIVLDPHGDMVDDILRLIPKHRVKDVVVLDPSDSKYAACFNPLSSSDPAQRVSTMFNFLGTFRRIFHSDWDDRMDHVLRYAMLGLLTTSHASIPGLRRMLIDEEFCHEVARNSPDESVKKFWLQDYVRRKKEYQEGAISRILNRIDEMLANATLKHIFSQTDNRFDFASFVKERKIVLLKLPKGLIGSDNALLLGSVIIWKIYQAAIAQASLPSTDRRKIYLYIDEFQNFANSSFVEILSESRKFGLCLTLANQYLGQLSEDVRHALIGNIPNIVAFRTGAQDAASLGPLFSTRFDTEDMINLPLRNFLFKMTMDGHVQEPFSGTTIDLHHPAREESYANECMDESRKKYCVNRSTEARLEHVQV